MMKKRSRFYEKEMYAPDMVFLRMATSVELVSRMASSMKRVTAMIKDTVAIFIKHLGKLIEFRIIDASSQNTHLINGALRSALIGPPVVVFPIPFVYIFDFFMIIGCKRAFISRGSFL